MYFNLLGGRSDLAEVTLENYMNQCLTNSEFGFHRNSKTALALFQFISRTATEYLILESILNPPVDPSGSVYRQLESVNDFLSKIKLKHLLRMRHLRTVKEIRLSIELLIRRIEHYIYPFSTIVDGFKTASFEADAYLLRYAASYKRLNSILHALLDNMKEEQITDLSSWKPTKAFYCDSSPITVKIEPGERVIFLTTEEIHFREFGRDYEIEEIKLKEMMGSINEYDFVVRAESLDWSFNESTYRALSPLSYVFKAEERILHLFEVGNCFRVEMNRNEILPKNLPRVMEMCKRLLLCGETVLDQLQFNSIKTLFGIVFSVLDRVHFLTLKSVRTRDIFYRIAHQCSAIRRVSLRYKNKFDQHNDGSFDDYMDIVYKFIVNIFIPLKDKLTDSHLSFTFLKIELVIRRSFLPTEIRGRICNWKKKFSFYSTFVDLVNRSVTNRFCSLCQKPIDIFNPETIALSENCNHFHCVICLMKIVNECTESKYVTTGVGRLPLLFKCPHPSCSCLHQDFISANLYGSFRNEMLMNLSAYPSLPLPDWGLEKTCACEDPLCRPIKMSINM